MEEEVMERLGEIGARLDEITGLLRDGEERAAETAELVTEIHRAWCLEVERQRRALPDRAIVPCGPGDRVSWTDPKDASRAAWGGTVEFVGLDQAGTPIAHVDFAGYGRRNLPVDQLIVGILT
jgi:hypothetical protein